MNLFTPWFSSSVSCRSLFCDDWRIVADISRQKSKFKKSSKWREVNSCVAIICHTDNEHPERAFFSKIRNFWAWADKLGRNFMRHLGYFWPNYKHYFGKVSPLSMGKSSWFYFLQKTLIFDRSTCSKRSKESLFSAKKKLVVPFTQF